MKTWEEKSETEGLRVVHCDTLIDTPLMAKEQQWPGWEEGKYENLTQHNYLDIDLSMQNENKETMKAKFFIIFLFQCKLCKWCDKNN